MYVRAKATACTQRHTNLEAGHVLPGGGRAGHTLYPQPPVLRPLAWWQHAVQYLFGLLASLRLARRQLGLGWAGHGPAAARRRNGGLLVLLGADLRSRQGEGGRYKILLLLYTAVVIIHM